MSACALRERRAIVRMRSALTCDCMARYGPDPHALPSPRVRRFFRRHPEHLERFCGRQAGPEPLHHSPAELSRDSEFRARCLMHLLAQLQVDVHALAGRPAMP